jgi:hypothetical protein
LIAAKDSAWRRYAVLGPPSWSASCAPSSEIGASGPPYLEFARAGKARLHARTLRCGGPHLWAAKLDLQVEQHCVRWSPEAIEEALEPFLAGRETWASREEFAAAGLMPLYYAIRRHGGFAHWAERFGLRYGKGHRYLWPPERIERELRRLAKGGAFPSSAQMREAGLNSLYEAIRREGGAARWADRLGLPLEPERSNQ